MTRTAFVTAVVAVLSSTALGLPTTPDLIPNGRASKDPKSGLPCEPLGHHGCVGGAPRTSFGLDFKAAGAQWTKELCEKDSDGDGFSNGVELGDPCCLWTVSNKNPKGFRVTNLSHPGDKSSFGTNMPTCDESPAIAGGSEIVEVEEEKESEKDMEKPMEQPVVVKREAPEEQSEDKPMKKMEGAMKDRSTTVVEKPVDESIKKSGNEAMNESMGMPMELVVEEKTVAPSQTEPEDVTTEASESNENNPVMGEKPIKKCVKPTEPAVTIEPPVSPLIHIQVYEASVQKDVAGVRLEDGASYCPETWFPETGFTLRCIVDDSQDSGGATWYIDGKRVRREKFRPYTINGDVGGISRTWKTYPKPGGVIGCEVGGELIEVNVIFSCKDSAERGRSV